MVISVYDPTLTINISADEAELVQHAEVCSVDEQSSGGTRESFPLQRGDAHDFALQLKVLQSVECGDAQRTCHTTWFFQGAYGSNKDWTIVYQKGHGAVSQH